MSRIKDGKHYTIIIWHPYPLERPEEVGQYFVTLTSGKVRVDKYYPDFKCWQKYDTTVKAWGIIKEGYTGDMA